MKKSSAKHFVSELDQFLAEFDCAHPQSSASQQQEIKKAQHIAQQRDHTEMAQKSSDIWEEF